MVPPSRRQSGPDQPGGRHHPGPGHQRVPARAGQPSRDLCVRERQSRTGRTPCPQPPPTTHCTSLHCWFCSSCRDFKVHVWQKKQRLSMKDPPPGGSVGPESLSGGGGGGGGGPRISSHMVGGGVSLSRASEPGGRRTLVDPECPPGEVIGMQRGTL